MPVQHVVAVGFDSLQSGLLRMQRPPGITESWLLPNKMLQGLVIPTFEPWSASEDRQQCVG